MAKKTTSTKSSSAKKAATTRKKNKAALEAKAKAHRQMWAIILFALGIFFGAVSFIKGENLWNGLHNALFGLFGWSGFLIAPLLIYIAVIASLDKPTGSIGHKVWQSMLVIVLISGAIQIFTLGIPEANSFWGKTVELYESGVTLKGGGVLSFLFGVPLLHLFGTGISSKIVIILLIFVFLMIFTGSTIIGLLRTAYTPVKKMETAYVERMEEKLSRPAAAVDSPRFNINVPGPSLDKKSVKEEPLVPILEEVTPPSPPERLSAKERLLSTFKSKAEPVPVASSSSPTPEMQPAPPSPAHEEDALAEDMAGQPFHNPVLDDIIQKVSREAHHDPQLDAVLEKIDDDFAAQAFGGAAAVMAPQPPVVPPAEPVIKEQLTPDNSIQAELEAAAAEEPVETYVFPPISLLKEGVVTPTGNLSEELKANAEKLVNTLQSFGVQTRIIDISRGPAVTRYELQPSAGVKISKITNLADDIALNLAASGVRIEAPIPNKAAVGIEVPNQNIGTVSIREIIDSNSFIEAKSRLTVSLGRDVSGNIAVTDLSKMPHLLIAGSTGSGKSVCINSLIISLIYKSTPDEVKLLMIDPKVVELGVYNSIPHLLVPVVTDPRKAAGALGWAVTEMLNRYKLFADNGVRDLNGYNALANTKDNMTTMPQVVIIIDELADLMMAAPAEVEDSICRLAQMARAAGMHLVIATQRPSVDVITGIIKANIPSRIAFAVSSQVDSRTILDMGGAEKLLGRGDMLFYPVGAAKPIRVQGCFVTDTEVEQVVSFLKEGAARPDYSQDIIDEIDRQSVSQKAKKAEGGGFSDDDDMLPAAIECVIEAGQASTSLLQRRLKLGYARAARLVDDMESRGIVGPFEGSKPRQVLISRERWLEMKLQTAQDGGVEELI